MRFSVLDRANTIAGLSESETLRGVIEHARGVEKLGFERFLVAEHHAVPGIPGSQPAVLAAAVAAQTSTIRVGTGGIMLPNRQPLLAAEQIATLEALFPGRIDAGVGNSVGFTAPVRRALRQGDPREVKARYRDDLVEMLSYLDGTAEITARPFNQARTPVWILAGFKSVALAAELGLGVIIGGPSLVAGEGDSHRGLDYYRENFRPSAFAPEPKVIVSLDVAVADTTAAARDLLLPETWAATLSRRTGAFDYLEPVEELDEAALSAQDRGCLHDRLSVAVYGTPREVGERLGEIARYTGADEVLVTGGMSDVDGRARSEELLAQL